MSASLHFDLPGFDYPYIDRAEDCRYRNKLRSR